MRDRAFMDGYPGGSALANLAHDLIERGFDFVGCDEIMSLRKHAVLLTDVGAPARRTLRKLEGLAVPGVCFCLESPVIVHRVFHDLGRTVGKYRHTFIWPGAEDQLRGTSTRFHPLFWPNDRRVVEPGAPWEHRGFLVMINSNKRGHVWSPRDFDRRDLKGSARVIAASLLARIYRSTDPWLRADLYLERLHAIGHFSLRDDFDLFGARWADPVPGTRGRFDSQIARAYRGPAEYRNKLPTLQKYRYALCFENTIYPGYITDKIFDCFFAGVIPIYLGAPDIEEYVPRETFIDMREFPDYSELESFLDSMSSEAALVFLESARNFLASEDFTKFTSGDFVRRVSSAIEEVNAGL